MANPAIHAFRTQFTYLKSHPSIQPNQLKWKQLVNVLNGSRRGESQALVRSMDMDDIVPIAVHFCAIPSQSRNHETFAGISERALLLRKMYGPFSSGNSVSILRAILDAALDICDSDTRRFRSAEISNAIEARENLGNVILSDMFTDEGLSYSHSAGLVYITALAKFSSSWCAPIDMYGDRIQRLVSETMTDSRLTDAPLRTRTELAWAAARVAPESTNLVRRLFSESDMLSACNPSADIHASSTCILQLIDAFRLLNKQDSTVFESATAVLERMSKDPACADPIFASHCMWWTARSGSESHDHVADWMRTCINRSSNMSDNDLWLANTGLQYMYDTGKLSGLPSQEIDQIKLCLSRRLLQRQSPRGK